MKLFFSNYFLALFVMMSVLSACYAQLPKVQIQGDISYISGGIGEDETKAMQSESKNWPLSIEFSEYLVSQDLWVAHVYLRILDANGKAIFEAVVDGPIFLGKVPPGNYELLATYQGITKSRKIQIVKGKSLHIPMNWRLSKSGT